MRSKQEHRWRDRDKDNINTSEKKTQQDWTPEGQRSGFKHLEFSTNNQQGENSPVMDNSPVQRV